MIASWVLYSKNKIVPVLDSLIQTSVLVGHKVEGVPGREKWVLNDPANYDGLIPQNAEWTEFIDEKTGEWVYLDEYGEKTDKPVST